MRQINCYIPIKLCITGRLSDAQLEQLGEAIVRTVTSRIAFAERTITAGNRTSLQGVDELIRADYDPSREDLGTSGYVLPFYDNGGQKRSVSLQRPRQQRLWRVRQYFNIFLRLQTFIEYLESLYETRTKLQEIRALYLERFHEILSVEVRYIETVAPIFLKKLVEEVKEHIAESLPGSHQVFYFGYSVSERDRQRLATLDETKKVASLPDMSNNPGGSFNGSDFLNRGGKLLFVSITLPIVQEGDIFFWNNNNKVEVSLRVRDLDFLIDPSSFEAIYQVSWHNYKQELGEQPAKLQILQLYSIRRVHYDTLNFLTSRAVAARIATGTYYFGGLHLLNQSTLDWLPEIARSHITRLTSEVILSLSREQERGYWESGWVGAFIYTTIKPTEEQLNAVRYRPEARRLAVEAIAKLQGDRSERLWRWHFLSFLRGTSSGIGFEYFLEELENQGWFDRLFAAVEEARLWDLHELLLLRTADTRYVYHPRFRQSLNLINERRRQSLNHAYIVTNTLQELHLEKRTDAIVRPGQVLGDVWAVYRGLLRNKQRIKPSRKAELERVLKEESESLIREILTGQNSNTYSEEAFAKAALERTVRKIGLEEFQKNYVETVDYEISARLIKLERVEGIIDRYSVTYQLVRRVEGETWEDIENGLRTTSDGEFEEMLVFWGIQQSAVVVEYASKIVLGGAVLVVAWEVGAISLLIELGGGAVAVGVSIAISELIYLLTAEHYTLEGFLLAALDGYLFAVGFRFAGFVGRGIATRIGTESISRVVVGWITERFVVGTLGGASSALLITFSHDLLNVFLGRGSFSSPEQYIRQMALGAVLGVVFEFGAAPLQPLLRVTGRTALETVDQVIQRVRQEGITLPNWSGLTTEALSNLRQRLETFLEPGMARRIAAAFRERVAAVSEGLTQLPGQVGQLGRQAIFRRILELSEINLTRSAAQGLEKLLSSATGRLEDNLLLEFFNRLSENPQQALRFLENINASVVNMEQFFTALSRYSKDQQKRALEILLHQSSTVTPGGLLLTLEATGRLPGQTFTEQTATKGASLPQQQSAALLRTKALSLEHEANTLEQRAKILETEKPERAERMRQRAAQLRRDVALLQGEARNYEQALRSAIADLPKPEEIDQLFAQAQAETWIVVPLDEIEQHPDLIERLVRPVLRSRTGNRVVFRVEGGVHSGSRSQELIQIHPNGDVTLARATLNLNFGVAERAIEFVQNNRAGARIKIFEVDERWFQSLRSAAIPERGRPALEGQPPLREVTGLPRLVDVRFGDDQLQIPPTLADELQQFIIPGSGRIFEISP
jgi:hypothetical protein